MENTVDFGELIARVKAEPNLELKDAMIAHLKILQEGVKNGRKRPTPCNEKEWF